VLYAESGTFRGTANPLTCSRAGHAERSSMFTPRSQQGVRRAYSMQSIDFELRQLSGFDDRGVVARGGRRALEEIEEGTVVGLVFSPEAATDARLCVSRPIRCGDGIADCGTRADSSRRNAAGSRSPSDCGVTSRVCTQSRCEVCPAGVSLCTNMIIDATKIPPSTMPHTSMRSRPNSNGGGGTVDPRRSLGLVGARGSYSGATLNVAEGAGGITEAGGRWGG